jgi:hypothetical protein
MITTLEAEMRSTTVSAVMTSKVHHLAAAR